MSFPPPTEKQARIVWASLTAFSIALLVAILCAFVWGLGRVLNVLSPVLWPLAIAGIIAYLLDPVVDFFQRRNVSRRKSIILVFAMCAVVLAGLIASILPRMVAETEKLIADLPGYSRSAQDDIARWISARPSLVEWRDRFFPSRTSVTNPPAMVTAVPSNREPSFEPATNRVALESSAKTRETAWANRISESVLTWLGQMMPKLGAWVLAQISRVASWAGTIVGLAMVPVFAFYFLQEKAGIQKGWTNYLPLQESRLKDELVFVLNAINNYLIVFFRGQVLIAVCDAVLLVTGFVLLGLNYAVLFGVVAGLLSMVPYLGTIVTIVPIIVLAAVQFHDLLHPVMVVAIFGIVHAIEGFIVAPKIMGDRVGLHPLTVIFSVFLWSLLLGGLLGAILAVPLTATAKVLLRRYIWERQFQSKAASRPAGT